MLRNLAIFTMLASVWVPAASPAQDSASRLESLRRKGRDAEVTIFPVLLGDRVFAQVGEVVGILLERGGMEKLELSSREFRRPPAATMEETAAAFGEFVRTNALQTEFALYAEFLGSPASGVSEVRGMLVDKQGNLVWSDRQTPADEAFQKHKPGDPMECAMLLAARLGEILGLQDVLRPDAPEGKLARRSAEKAGVPGDAERAAMKQELATARAAFAGSRVVVFPILMEGRTDRTQAAQLARLMSQEKLGTVSVAEAAPAFETRPGPNELMRLWDTARAFREHLRRSPQAADYAVYAEYAFAPDGGVFIVHFVVCRPNGEWVIVDYQNGHHEDFQSMAPKSGDDCGRLVVKRLIRYLR